MGPARRVAHHVWKHGDALATLAIDGATGQTRERVKLTAERFRALLAAARCSRGFGPHPLDLASPLPGVSPWPPVFAGEPLSRDMETLMRSRFLAWTSERELPQWARAVAYFAAALRDASPVVHDLAHRHLRRLLDIARAGLWDGHGPPPARAPKPVKSRKAPKPGKDGAR